MGLFAHSLEARILQALMTRPLRFASHGRGKVARNGSRPYEKIRAPA